MLNVEKQEYSYLVGLLQADGHMHKGKGQKGKMSYEISIKDEDIIYKLEPLLNCNYSIHKRIRDTNYKKNYESIALTICSLEFRNWLVQYVPYGKKDEIVEKPTNVIDIEYWRGIIDGNGSIGFTKRGIPFVGLVIKSDKLLQQCLQFVFEITGQQKICNKNKRDKIYNIRINNEDSQLFLKTLYYENCLSINRKYDLARQVMKWERPITMKKIENKKKWTSEEDNFIKNNTIEKSMQHLNRSKKSIRMRLWRLK